MRGPNNSRFKNVEVRNNERRPNWVMPNMIYSEMQIHNSSSFCIPIDGSILGKVVGVSNLALVTTVSVLVLGVAISDAPSVRFGLGTVSNMVSKVYIKKYRKYVEKKKNNNYMSILG